MAAKSYIVALEEHYQDAELKQHSGGPGASPDIVEQVKAATKGGVDYAVEMAGVTEIAMLFVRWKGGVSHNPAESVNEADVAVAIDVLVKFLELLAAEP